jgi:hypothetical protein
MHVSLFKENFTIASWILNVTFQFKVMDCNHVIIKFFCYITTWSEFIKSRHLKEPARFYSSRTIWNNDWTENAHSRKQSDSQYQYSVLRNNTVHLYHFKLPAMNMNIYTRNAFLKVINHCEKPFWRREKLGFLIQIFNNTRA